MKKTESVTYRTSKVVKNALLRICDEKKWSISQLSEEIIQEWLAKNYPELLEEQS